MCLSYLLLCLCFYLIPNSIFIIACTHIINRGGCVDETDCAGDLICGSNNCQSKFDWDDGDVTDCCDIDRTARCGDESGNNADGCCEDEDDKRCGLGE